MPALDDQSNLLHLRELLEENQPLWTCGETLLAELDMTFPREVQTSLEGVSQWGLKEIWLGQRIADHDRWKHSKGVLEVTAKWLDSLYERARIKWCPWPLEERKHAIRLAGIAALLHDFGHLPFAHLLADVLESIQWVPRGAGQAGMEGWVLGERFDQDVFRPTWTKLASALNVKSIEAQSAVHDLILGRFGVPWIQAILNSAVDADKIDYLCRDSRFLNQARWPTTCRLSTQSENWLNDFLSEQRVTHAGLLCLDGRSALAAADLLRERMFLHDRFYLSPEIRVAQRMAFEILQQFLIRSVMSDRFRDRISDLGGVERYNVRFQGKHGPADPIEVKAKLVADILEPLATAWGGGRDREFGMLRNMLERLRDSVIDRGYLSLLNECFKKLEQLRPGEQEDGSLQPSSCDIHKLARTCLVREPLVFHRKDFVTARDALRPVQHKYCREILIDIAKLPLVLAMPGRWRTSPKRSAPAGVDYGILVPEGPVSAWGPGSKARIPLTDNAVRQLERPDSRVLVIAPTGCSARVEYVWDRVRSVLLEAGVTLQSASRAEVA